MIDAKPMSDLNLQDYDKFMSHAILSVESISIVAMRVWRDVLEELERRNQVQIVSGSLENIGDALITRLYP
ncbi:MAG: hypothetical protein A2095_06460 [Sphingomonadales bacterium GWF1_63_6]|nr:MAG: hypothetical protein A2095_06460 [Sphingomonadales bacterium GWF1_63_6]